MKTPEQMCDTVEMVSVEWLLNNIHYSVDSLNDDSGHIDFEYMLRDKATDYSFPGLVHTIWERGFRVPICLYPNPYGADWALGNGHHRLSAAILLCLDQIPVYWSEHDYMSDDHTDTEAPLDYPDDPAQFIDFMCDTFWR